MTLLDLQHLSVLEGRTNLQSLFEQNVQYHSDIYNDVQQIWNKWKKTETN